MKTQNTLLFTSFMLIVILLACNGHELIEKRKKTLILGHKSTGNGVNDGFLENTLPAIREALKYADGVEADIQMSSSKTPWIYHDDLFNNLCETSEFLLKSKGYTCILQTPDSIIEQLRICKGGVKERIYKLEDLFDVLSKNKDKIASLDIKGYFDSTCVKYNNVDKIYQYNLADTIYALIQKYDVKDQIIAETNYTSVFERLKEKDSTIQCHFFIFNHLEDKIDYAIEKKADGLTINMHDKSYGSKQIDEIRNKNLKIQLWTIENEEDLKIALSYHPYAIQLDGLGLLKKTYKSNSQERKSQLFR